MLIIRIEPGTIYSVFRTLSHGGRAGRGRDVGNLKCIRLDRKGPDGAFINGRIRRDIYLIDPPVIRLTEFESIPGFKHRRKLVLTDQHVHRIGPAGVVDVIVARPEIHVVRRGKLTRRPAQWRIIRHIGVTIGRIRIESHRPFFQCRRRRGNIIAFIKSYAVDPEISYIKTDVECDGRRSYVRGKNRSCCAILFPFFRHGELLRAISRPRILGQFRLEIDTKGTTTTLEIGGKCIFLPLLKDTLSSVLQADIPKISTYRSHIKMQTILPLNRVILNHV